MRKSFCHFQPFACPAEIYLDRHHPKGLYHEDYELVAVMFASIPNYMDRFTEGDSEGMRSLEILNDIISGFDAVRVAIPSVYHSDYSLF